MPEHENVGYLSWDEWRRFRIAVDKSLIVVPWFRVAGYIRGEKDEIRASSPHPALGLPPTWIAAEEITRLSRELGAWENLEDVANDDYGAEVAKQFTREVETALARWPVEERPHQVRHLRCQECMGETILYRPPMFEGDDTSIACTSCGHSMTEEEFTVLLELLVSDVKKVDDIGGIGRLGAA